MARGALFLSLRSPAWKAKRPPCRRSSSLSAPAWMHPARSWGDSGPRVFAHALRSDSSNTVCNCRCSFRRHSQMLISTIVFLFFLFATYALFLLASRKSDAHQARLQQRVAEALEETTTRLPQDDIQITREDSIGGSPFINELLS